MSQPGKLLMKVTFLFVAIISLWTITQHVAWYFHDTLDTIGFMAFGVGVTLGITLWKGVHARVAFGVGLAIWSVPSWMIGYVYSAINAHGRFEGTPLALVIVSSTPFLLLLVVVSMYNRPYWS